MLSLFRVSSGSRWTRLAAAPLERLALVLAAGFTLYVVAYPLSVVTLPPMTDMPFHAAAMSVLRHYGDPAWHFREQFTVHPLAVPYVSFYVLGALLACVFPIALSARIAAAVMLVLLPAGLAVLFYGMKKSPLWGVLGLGLVWHEPDALGLPELHGSPGPVRGLVGFTLLLVDWPTRRRRVLLAACLLAIFATHIYRFPFAVVSVLVTGAVMYPATRRFKVVLLPLLPSLAAFAAWRLVAGAAFAGASHGSLALDLDWLRLAAIEDYLFHGFDGAVGRHEHALFLQLGAVILVVAAVTTLAFFASGRAAERSSGERRWGVGVTVLPLVLAAGFVTAYVVLPMTLGAWWYVYPREITSASFIALAALPDMPRSAPARLALVLVVGLAAGRIAYLVAVQYARFETLTAPFRAIVERIPRAPKLLYLVNDRSGISRSHSPFVHLPAWVQAERGGWLSFIFVSWELSPIRYRDGGGGSPAGARALGVGAPEVPRARARRLVRRVPGARAEEPGVPLPRRFIDPLRYPRRRVVAFRRTRGPAG